MTTHSLVLAVFLVHGIKPMIKINFLIKNCFNLLLAIRKQFFQYFMLSLTIDFLFSNIPFEEAIEISCNSFGHDKDISLIATGLEPTTT